MNYGLTIGAIPTHHTVVVKREKGEGGEGVITRGVTVGYKGVLKGRFLGFTPLP